MLGINYGSLGHAILNEGRDPTGMHVLNLKSMHKPAENRECNKTIHMSSMSERRFTLCHKLLPVIQMKLQCLLWTCNSGAIYLVLVVNYSIDCSVKVGQTSVCSFWFSLSVCRAHVIPCDQSLWECWTKASDSCRASLLTPAPLEGTTWSLGLVCGRKESNFLGHLDIQGGYRIPMGQHHLSEAECLGDLRNYQWNTSR